MQILKDLFIKTAKAIPALDRYLLLFRRKRLAESNGYPDWKTLVNSPLKESDNKTSEVIPKIKVLIATSMGSYLPGMHVESSLGAALTLRSCDVQVLLCDGVLPGCQMCEPRYFHSAIRFVKNGPQKSLCGHCYEPGRKCYESLGLYVHAYSDHLTDDEFALAEHIASDVATSELGDFVLDGLKVGEHAKAGALRFYARATIDDEPAAELVLRRYVKAAVLTALATRKLLEAEGYDVVVFNHGIYVPQGIIGEVARQLGIRVVNWNPAYRKNCFIFSHQDTYHHTLMEEPVSVWENMPWSVSRDELITEYLKSRWQGENDWIRFHENPYFERERILSEIGCDPDLPIIGCLTNVMWDAQLHYPANAFPNMLDWLLHTVNYFSSRPAMQLVIRVHPAEIRGSVPTRQPVIEELKRHFPILPANVYIVPPASNISTYALSELCNSVIIYGTKTGVELTSAGIPVIVAGEAWIRNKGMTMDADSKATYDHILGSLPFKSRLSDDLQSRAKRYAYHFFFRRMIPLNIFEPASNGLPFKFDGNLDGLKPGADPGLDCVCEGIIRGTPFVFDQDADNLESSKKLT